VHGTSPGEDGGAACGGGDARRGCSRGRGEEAPALLDPAPSPSATSAPPRVPSPNARFSPSPLLPPLLLSLLLSLLSPPLALALLLLRLGPGFRLAGVVDLSAPPLPRPALLGAVLPSSLSPLLPAVLPLSPLLLPPSSSSPLPAHLRRTPAQPGPAPLPGRALPTRTNPARPPRPAPSRPARPAADAVICGRKSAARASRSRSRSRSSSTSASAAARVGTHDGQHSSTRGP
jgi:hypothetical protein